jgi:hypothetical protein
MSNPVMKAIVIIGMLWMIWVFNVWTFTRLLAAANVPEPDRCAGRTCVEV